MVQGVNKTVIEVNKTGSPFFEKIVFYVTPEYGSLNAKQLKKAAASFTFGRGASAKATLRKKAKLRRNLFIMGVSLAVIAVLGVVILLIL